MTDWFADPGFVRRTWRRLIPANWPVRYWLWRHRNHPYHNLTGAVWKCSCSSSFKRPLPPEE